MTGKPSRCLRAFWPAWLGWLALPLPALLLWRSHDGRFVALCCFFVSCTSFTVSAFRQEANALFRPVPSNHWARPVERWRVRLSCVALTLLVQWAVFCAVCLIVNDPHDLVAPALALLTLVPSLCIAPYLVLATHKPFAAVVLTLFVVGCMKMVAGTVTVLAYGWHAGKFGNTTLTWTQPNLIVCTFLAATAIACMGFYIAGQRRFCRLYATCSSRAALGRHHHHGWVIHHR
jgi:hypothetical protein